MLLRSPISTLFPYTTLFRSADSIHVRLVEALCKHTGVKVAVGAFGLAERNLNVDAEIHCGREFRWWLPSAHAESIQIDRKSTRLNSSHRCISYAVFCLKKKN